MSGETVFEVQATPEQVFDYFADPRHLVAANHAKPIIEQSEGPQTAGSWYLIKLDQLRARVEYTTFDRPRRIAASLAMTGLGSGGATSKHDWSISAAATAGRSVITARFEGSGGLIRANPLMRLVGWLQFRRMKRAIERSAARK